MEDGALRRTVKQMSQWGALVRDPTSTAKRAVYAFSEGWRGDLRGAIRHQLPVELLDGQQALLLSRLPAQESDMKDIAWVVEFGHGGRSLLAVADDAGASIAQLRRRLRQQGVGVEVLEIRTRWSPAARHEK